MRLGNLSKVTDKIIDSVLDSILDEGSELIDNIIDEIRNSSLVDDINIPEASTNNLEIINIGKKLGVTMRNTWSLIQSIEHIYHNKIEGAFVESGIYTGNSIILMKKIYF